MKNVIVMGILCVFLLSGCQSSTASFNQAMELIDKAAAVAEKQGTAYNATLRWNGKIGGGWIQRIEVDSGVSVEIHFQGNAAAERATVVRPGDGSDGSDGG